MLTICRKAPIAFLTFLAMDSAHAIKESYFTKTFETTSELGSWLQTGHGYGTSQVGYSAIEIPSPMSTGFINDVHGKTITFSPRIEQAIIHANGFVKPGVFFSDQFTLAGEIKLGTPALYRINFGPSVVGSTNFGCGLASGCYYDGNPVVMSGLSIPLKSVAMDMSSIPKGYLMVDNWESAFRSDRTYLQPGTANPAVSYKIGGTVTTRISLELTNPTPTATQQWAQRMVAVADRQIALGERINEVLDALSVAKAIKSGATAEAVAGGIAKGFELKETVPSTTDYAGIRNTLIDASLLAVDRMVSGGKYLPQAGNLIGLTFNRAARSAFQWLAQDPPDPNYHEYFWGSPVELSDTLRTVFGDRNADHAEALLNSIEQLAAHVVGVERYFGAIDANDLGETWMQWNQQAGMFLRAAYSIEDAQEIGTGLADYSELFLTDDEISVVLKRRDELISNHRDAFSDAELAFLLGLNRESLDFQLLADAAKNSPFGDNTEFFQEWNAFMAPVPEPETYALLLGGLGLIGIVARRAA